MAIDNITSNDTYIFKDFQGAYEELVDTIGKLNNKWLIDGEGNESDPGVVLIKAIASAVDKLSFNSDKNALENMPDTVQVESTARRLFSPVYNMKWYRSAVGTVVMRNSGDSDIEIPPYLMLSSDDGAVVYTIFGSQFTLSADTTKTDIQVIEGRIKTLTANGSDCITIESFVDNKIYLDDFNVAQNGIIVEPYDSTQDVNTWTMCDNIYVQNWSASLDPNGGRYYEFKVDSLTNRPYLHFVDDLPDKIGNGLKIRYILSNGVNGNISAGKLTKVFASDSEVLVDSEHLTIANISPIGNGQDPETIGEARRNYFKDIDICDTLVTLRDYTNAIYLADGLVSNCFVCDKTNDVQTFVMIDTDGGIKSDTSLQLMQLKFYGLTYKDIEDGTEEDQDALTKNILYANNYKQTFDIINAKSSQTDTPAAIPENVDDFIYESRSISNEFTSIRNRNAISMVKDYYTLSIDLLFRQRLTTEQQNEIRNKVYKALLDNLNARAVDFGEKITYNKVQQIVYAADTRILGASIYGLDDVNFSASAVYWTPCIAVKQYDSLPAASDDLDGQYGVTVGGSTATLHYCNGTAWNDVSTYTIPSVSNRLYDLSMITPSTPFAAIYTENSTWNEGMDASKCHGANKWVCLSKPSDTFSSSTKVYKIAIEKTSTSGTAVNVYPSTPIKLNWVSNGIQYISWGGVNYKITVVGTNDSKAAYWEYDEVPTFYYDPTVYVDGVAVTEALGEFKEEKISSEIDNYGVYDDNMKIGTTSGKGKLRGQLQTEVYAKTVLAGKSSIYDTNFKFSPKFQDEKSQISDGAAYIKPSLTLTLKSEYKLRDNEYIQILTPEFETIANYAFYVYVGYYNTDSAVKSIVISENQNYELGANEYITFYYRASDNDRYTYAIYNNGNIICPSKTIVLYNLSFQSALASELSQPKSNKTGICSGSLNAVVVSATTATYSRDRLTALKSQDSCDVKKLLTQDIEAYSFVSNSFTTVPNTMTTTYSMTFDKLRDKNGVRTYFRVLEEGEAFYLYDKVGSDYVLNTVVGAGAILNIYEASANNTKTITCTVSNGIASITEPSGYTMASIGSEIFQLAPGMYVKPSFGATTSATSPSSTTETTGTDYGNASWRNKVSVTASQVYGTLTGSQDYPNNIASSTTIGSTWGPSSDGTYWNSLISIIKAQIDNEDWSDLGAGATTVQIEVEYANQKVVNGVVKPADSTPKVYFHIIFNITPQTQLSLTDSFTSYASMPTIMYRNADESTYTIVRQSNITDFDMLARSALLVNIEEGGNQIISNSNEFPNVSTQSVVVYDNSSQYAIFDTANMLPSGATGKVLLASSTSVTAIGGKQPLSELTTMYCAEEKTSEDNTTDVTYGSDISKVSIAAGSSVTIDIPAVIVGDGYIMYARFDEKREHKLRIKYANTSTYLTDMYQNAYGDDNGPRILPLNEDSLSIDVTTASNGQITIVNDGDFDTRLTITAQLVAYKHKTSLSTPQTNAILAKMGELDTKLQYRLRSNYNYPIENPIASAAFLNTNHPYNPFTICQMSGIDWRTQ